MERHLLIQAKADVVVFHVAACQDCQLPIPFYNASERDVWMQRHIEGTGHKVHEATEIRISTQEVTRCE